MQIAGTGPAARHSMLSFGLCGYNGLVAGAGFSIVRMTLPTGLRYRSCGVWSASAVNRIRLPPNRASPLVGRSRRGQLSSASPTACLTTADYMPPNGFFTVSLLVTDVTPGTPRAIASARPIWAASVTVPFSVTAPSFAMTLMSPALISLYFRWQHKPSGAERDPLSFRWVPLRPIPPSRTHLAHREGYWLLHRSGTTPSWTVQRSMRQPQARMP